MGEGSGPGPRHLEARGPARGWRGAALGAGRGGASGRRGRPSRSTYCGSGHGRRGGGEDRQMSKELLGAVSAMALFAGVAAAQDAGPSATPAPATPQTTTPAPALTTPAAAGEAARAADKIGRPGPGPDREPPAKGEDG